MNQVGSADLVSRIMAGDRQAEAELVEHYSRGVRIIIRREVSNAAIAEDLYQEVFRIVIEKIRHGIIREPEKLLGFVCGVVRNLIIDHFRQAARHESLAKVEEAIHIPHHAPNQLEELLQKENANLVRRILREMPNKRDIQLLFRFYLAEDEKEQICSDLGLTSQHFNRVLHRARGRYLQIYERMTGVK